jgi:hypothetical protein
METCSLKSDPQGTQRAQRLFKGKREKNSLSSLCGAASGMSNPQTITTPQESHGDDNSVAN